MQELKNRITGRYTEITEQDMIELETKYDFKFPECLKGFYLKYNAGKLEKNLYAIGDDEFIFHSFYSIKHGYATLNEKMSSNYNDDWWPKRFIPFGYDGGGNSFCFHKDTGEIYYLYDDDSDDDDNIPIVYLAPDFLSFMNNMAAKK